MPPTEEFDPRKHVIQLKGKWYLETKYRIQWFRSAAEHPRGCISTEVISTDPLMVKATIYDGEGSVLATGHATAVDTGKTVWTGRGLEKAETAAIGRALAHAGYGTQFAGAEEANESTNGRGARSSYNGGGASQESESRRAAELAANPNSSAPPPRGSRAWHENPDALPGLERRLRNQIAPAMTLADAEQLVGQSLTAYTTSEAAFNAVRQAHAEFINLNPA